MDYLFAEFDSGMVAVRCGRSNQNQSEDLGWLAESVEDSPHGDWKTQSVKTEYRGLHKGNRCVIKYIWQNFYGCWARVEFEGKLVDIYPKALRILSKPTL